MFDPVLYCLMSQGQGLTCWECLIEALPYILIEIRSNESSDSIPFGMRDLGIPTQRDLLNTSKDILLVPA
jgi:hypothetical protein